LAFVFAAGLMIMGGAVFVGFVLIVVYVGSVLIFSLFVIMMLDLRVESKSNYIIFILIALALGLLLCIDVAVPMYSESAPVDFEFLRVLYSQPNIVIIGYVLYSWYAIPLILCALILLVAMIGTIVLLLDIDPSYMGVAEQSVYSQDIGPQVMVQDFEVMELRAINIRYEDPIPNVGRSPLVGSHVLDIVPNEVKLPLTIEGNYGIVLLPHPQYLDTTKWVRWVFASDPDTRVKYVMELPPTVNGAYGVMTIPCPDCWDRETWVRCMTTRSVVSGTESEMSPFIIEGTYGIVIIPYPFYLDSFKWKNCAWLIEEIG
jgi:NADH-quinone oxidoreductase subunit J